MLISQWQNYEPDTLVVEWQTFMTRLDILSVACYLRLPPCSWYRVGRIDPTRLVAVRMYTFRPGGKQERERKQAETQTSRPWLVSFVLAFLEIHGT